MQKKIVSVSEAEMEVMEMLWDQEGTIKQSQLLALFVADGKVWKRQTLNTFLSRLEDKGLIKRENRMVEPLYSREEYGGIQIKAILDRMYGGMSKSKLDVDGKAGANIRDILFRGKKETTGEWVEGYYTFYSNEYSEGKLPQGVIRNTRGFVERVFFVIPETVCEYTGAIDIEINKIFVNDIVKYDGSIGIVRFGQYGNGFHFGYYIQWLHSLHLRNELYFWASKVAVIGNIFDNTELVPEIESAN